MPSERRDLPAWRNLVTQNARVGGQRTIYLTVHDDPLARRTLCSCEGRRIAQPKSWVSMTWWPPGLIALQYGAPLEKAGDMLGGTKFEPAGPVSLHPRIRNCSSLPDLIGGMCWSSSVAATNWHMRETEAVGSHSEG